MATRHFGGQVGWRLGFSGIGTESAALLLGAGVAADPVTSSAASKNFVGFWTESTDATGTDSRNHYLRHYIGGASGSGETVRAFTTVNGAGAVGAHGIHASVSYGTDGTCTGESAAIRATLQVPDKTLGGTNAAVYAELWADGESSAVSNGSFLRCVLGGNATGLAAVEDTAYLFVVEGGTNAAGNVCGAVDQTPTLTSKTTAIRIKLNGVVHYLPAYTV